MTSQSISDPTLAELKMETARDAVLQELVSIVQKGWPESLSCILIASDHLRSELVVEEGLVFKGQRYVVPSVMLPEILKILKKIHLDPTLGS